MIAPARTVNDVVWLFAPREGGDSLGRRRVLSAPHRAEPRAPRPVYGPRPWIEVSCGRLASCLRSWFSLPTFFTSTAFRRFLPPSAWVGSSSFLPPSALDRIFLACVPCLAPTMSPTRFPFSSLFLLPGSSGRGQAALGSSPSRRLLYLRVRTSGARDPVHSSCGDCVSSYGAHARLAFEEGR